ncbi:MAG: ArnT family glycosyltransferase [Phycisphaerae bacterium]
MAKKKKKSLPAKTRSKLPLRTLLVAFLLVAGWLLSFSALLEKSPTFDEMGHLMGGYTYWQFGDWRMVTSNGMLPQRLMAIPLMFGDYRFPSMDQASWWVSHTNNMAQQFFYESGNDSQHMVMLGRAMMATVMVGLAFMIYRISRRLFGETGGLVSLAAVVLSPLYLAYAPITTSDMTVSFMFLASGWAFWAVLQRVTWPRLLLSGLAMGLLFMAKFSGLLMVPMGGLMLALRMIVKRPLPVGAKRVVQGRLGQAGVLAGTVLAHVVMVVVVIWAFHGFRYQPFNHYVEGRDRLFDRWEDVLDEPGLKKTTILFARDHHLLPESYLNGLAAVLKYAQRLAFLNGRYSVTGFRAFFPYCFLAKNQIQFLALLALSAWAAIRTWKRLRKEKGQPIIASAWDSFYRTAPLWIVSGVYMASAVASDMNIGVRHILPVHMPLFVLAGGAAYWLNGSLRWARRGMIALLALMAAETLWVWPNYLPYFNLLAGGSSNGYKHLADSSVDWGQDLPGLKKWLDDHDCTMPAPGQRPKAYFAYFGAADPSYYRIPARQLPSFMDMRRDLTLYDLYGGYYCISASVLECCPDFAGRWNEARERMYQERLTAVGQLARAGSVERDAMIAAKGQAYWAQVLHDYDYLRFARLAAYLRNYKPGPMDQIGHSILVFKLSDDEVKQAIQGPPAELAPGESLNLP